MRAYLLCFVLLVMAFSGCGGGAGTTANNSVGAKRYPLKGTIVSVDPAAKKAEVDHEAIEGYMPAMTMKFPIHADWVWDELSPGAQIRAELVVDNAAPEPYWLENIGIVAVMPKDGQDVPEIKDNVAQVGKDMPDFSLTNQDGKRISLADFKGHPLAITFIYSRCPLADYCIKMSTNFSDLANQLKDDPEMKAKMRLLSVSFDPETDTPQKLRTYGLGYLGKGAEPDFTVWQLAVGKAEEVRKMADFFGLRYEIDAEDKTQYQHSLRTAVITPDGKVAKVLTGNDWGPSELLREMKKTTEPQ